MREKPGLFWVTFGMVARVALVLHLVALVGHVTRRAAVTVVFEDGNRMVGFVPALRMWQLHTMARSAEVRLDMTGGARLSAFGADDIGVGGGPRVALNAFGMVARVAVTPRLPSLNGPMTRDATVLSSFQERSDVLGFVPALGVGHLKTVACVAELLFLVAGRARWVRIGEADPVPSGPGRVRMARWPRNHREGMTRRAGQGGLSVDAVAVETRVHRRFDGCLIDVRLDRMTRAAADRVGRCVVVGVVKDHSRRTVARPGFVEVEVTLRAPGERGIADDRGCRCRQLIG